MKNIIPVRYIKAPLPDVLNENHSSYVKDKIEKIDFYFLVDQKYVLMPGELTIQKEGDASKEITWMLWVKLIPKDFISMTQNLSGEIASMDGILISDVFLYENTKDLKVKIEFELTKEVKIPNILILENQGDLYFDFINGINNIKYMQFQSELLGRDI